MSQFKGDLAGARAFAARVRNLSSSAFKAGLAARIGAALVKQVADEFREGRDPYGRPWSPPKLRSGQPLRDTGRMAASVNAQTQDGRVRISIPVVYASVHQTGATIRPVRANALRFKAGGRFYTLKVAVIPRRQIVPEQSTGGLGPIWSAAVEAEAASWIRSNLER